MKADIKPLSYKDAGVDIDAGDALVEQIKPFVKRTQRPGWLGGIGGFGALFEVPIDRYRKPVLVSGTDGVGTKLKLAQILNNHSTIGIDLVAMCVNDILAQGAEPLYFLDYYATGKLDTEMAATVIKGIAKGCEISGMALIGGETAEMPGLYAESDYDLAGFCVGVVEKDHLISGSTIKPGDKVIALASSGPHSNGYSLIRKILERCTDDLNIPIADTTLADALIEPTRIYVRPVLDLIKQLEVKAIAHITGGGITGNLNRVLPAKTKAIIELNSWQLPEIFRWLAESGNINQAEMFRTFNCGVGLMLVVADDNADRAVSILNQAGERAWVVGVIDTLDDGQPLVELNG